MFAKREVQLEESVDFQVFFFHHFPFYRGEWYAAIWGRLTKAIHIPYKALSDSFVQFGMVTSAADENVLGWAVCVSGTQAPQASLLSLRAFGTVCCSARAKNCSLFWGSYCILFWL